MADQHPHPASPPPWLAEPGMNLTMGEAATVLGSLLRMMVGDATLRGERICNDTRLIAAGDIFIALTGNRDGHSFVPLALERGAAFVIVAQWPLTVPLGARQGALVVHDVDAALVRLASWWRMRHDILVIGIGGGVGKTTTKETVAGLLSQRHGAEHILKTPANWNDARGLSLALLGLRDHHQRAVVEMGMDRQGEVAQLAAIARPRWGIVTSVSATHLEFFPDMAALIATERGMVESLPPDGLALLNSDDRLVRGMIPAATCPVYTFGTLPGDDLRAIRLSSRGGAGLTFVAQTSEANVAVSTTLVGRHLVTSALAALSVALADGWSLADAASALSAVQIAQRMQFHPGIAGSTIIDDTYNASPESMLASLDLLADWPREQGGRRMALLGTMRELGTRSIREHHRLGRRAAARCSTLWVTGEESHHIADGATAGGLRDVRVFATPDEAAADCATTLAANDVLLIKASHAVGLDGIVSRLLAGS